jgi:hypothetical protein
MSRQVDKLERTYSATSVPGGPIMPSVERALLVVNRVAGTGHQPQLVETLCEKFTAGLGSSTAFHLECVDSHAAARAAATKFLGASTSSALIVAGGGGGTLRAVIEGICQHSTDGSLPSAERVRIGSLRMGSGNLFAKQLGVPRDSLVGVDGLLRSVNDNRAVPCCIMRCVAFKPDGGTQTFYACSMGGFGQFGRVPGDLARYHARWPRLQKFSARWIGIERVTDFEYGFALLLRSWACALRPALMESISVRVDGRDSEAMKLLAGALLNFKVPALPFEPGITVEDAALSLHLIPFRRRSDALSLVLFPGRLARKALTIKLDRGTVVDITLIDRKTTEFFLDEDTHPLYTQITLTVAGTLAFVPCPEYRATRRPEERSS